ncbi:hypothetical protein PENSPDRAFT_166378 [Peniophora sp. CONT]|nr:hypothetical protein PENSPDRAFT_166378 [Peniophora sp. CONT]
MKFSFAIAAFALVSSAAAASVTQRDPQFGQGFGGKGGQGQNQQQQQQAAQAAQQAAANKNKGGNQGGNNGGAAAAAAASSAAAASAAAAAKASATAAAGGNNAGAGGNAAGNAAAAGGNGGDAQSSTTLLQSVIATGFAKNGQETPTAGQVASLTSTNNFINFCATTNLPITNGQQIKTGSCNPAPMGQIAPQTNMPAAKFVNPPNMGNIAANTPFTITMAIKNLQAGNFVNAQSNYYSAPQQLNAQNTIIGHSHFVIEQLQSMTQTTPLDNTKFAFFQGVNTAADAKGNLNVDVTAGLPAGTYRLGSINSAANHQPVLVAVAQHGLLDDVVYFTVGGNGEIIIWSDIASVESLTKSL